MCERILTLAFDITEDERAPIASEALERTPCGAPGTHQAPRAVAQSAWLEEQLAQVSRAAEAIRYALKHWDGLTRILGDGCIKLDTNIVERSLNRKNALFAGLAVFLV
jgi:hypothetical protein